MNQHEGNTNDWRFCLAVALVLAALVVGGAYGAWRSAQPVDPSAQCYALEYSDHRDDCLEQDEGRYDDRR